jgi:EAL domain-containing protein (putative c-di-GMP-specific phosphodiesterase class I)/CheY-like chemotaxis protein
VDGERSAGSQLPVLVVDDEESVRRLYVTALRRAGYATLEAEDGTAALEVIRSQPVGLLLIDNHMPGMSGMDVIERVREEGATRTLPAILITGSGDLPNRVRGLEIGANDYVVKTTHLSEILARVRAQIRASTAWTEALAQQVEERARVVSALGSVTAADSAEETAEALVGHLAELDGVAFIELFQAPDGDSLIPLAGWAADRGAWRSGTPLPPADVQALLERARRGPWMEQVDALGGTHPGRLLAREVGTISAAPMRLGEVLIGLLLLGTPRVAAQPIQTGDLLAATIDYAAVCNAVLGPALQARGREASARHRLEGMLPGRDFHPVFQPLVGLSDGEVIGYEALTRFADGVAPEVRFAEATRLGLGRPFEEATVGAILETARRLPRGKWLGINVTPQLVLEPNWLERLLTGEARRLIVELTEHSPIEDYATLRRILDGLPASVSVAVDDAGAGYASLRHIYELRPQYVKLDMSLVRDIERDPVRQALVAGLVHFAEDTGSRLIAEGIETEAEASVMRRLNVTLGQGFLFGRPLEIDEIAEAAS